MRLILISSIHAINNTRVAYAFADAAVVTSAAVVVTVTTSVPVSITNIVIIRITCSQTIKCGGHACITTRYISKVTTAAVVVAVAAILIVSTHQSAQITVGGSVTVY